MPVVSVNSIAFGTPFAQNANFFINDLIPKGGPGGNDPTKFRVTLFVTTANAVLQMRVDATHFAAYNSGNALTANAWNMFDLHVRPGDTINFQFSNVGGATIGAFRVDELDNEG